MYLSLADFPAQQPENILLVLHLPFVQLKQTGILTIAKKE
jgi:hypothetical protein